MTKELLNEIEEITNTNYNFNGDYSNVEKLISIIDDLLIEVKKAQEKLNELENDLNENYRPVSVAEQVGINDKDFI
jgi:hypothetical protein